MRRLMTVDEAKEVCRDRSVWRCILSGYYASDTGRSFKKKCSIVTNITTNKIIKIYKYYNFYISKFTLEKDTQKKIKREI